MFGNEVVCRLQRSSSVDVGCGISKNKVTVITVSSFYKMKYAAGFGKF